MDENLQQVQTNNDNYCFPVRAMNREEFVNAFIECLKNNENLRSYDDTAEGAYSLFDLFIL